MALFYLSTKRTNGKILVLGFRTIILKSQKFASFLVEDGGGGEGAVVEGGGQDDRLLGAWLALLEPERSIMYFNFSN